MKWFGYRLHLVADTRYELPFDFRVEAASVFETRVCRKMTSEILSNAEAGACCVDYVADRGLDDDQLRRQLHENGVTPFIEDPANVEGRAALRHPVAHSGILRGPSRYNGVYGMRQGILRLSAKR